MFDFSNERDRRAFERIRDEIWQEVMAGRHDSSLGLRPTAVELDRDGDFAVAYPGGPDWMPWTTKVRRG